MLVIVPPSKDFPLHLQGSRTPHHRNGTVRGSESPPHLVGVRRRQFRLVYIMRKRQLTVFRTLPLPSLSMNEPLPYVNLLSIGKLISPSMRSSKRKLTHAQSFALLHEIQLVDLFSNELKSRNKLWAFLEEGRSAGKLVEGFNLLKITNLKLSVAVIVNMHDVESSDQSHCCLWRFIQI